MVPAYRSVLFWTIRMGMNEKLDTLSWENDLEEISLTHSQLKCVLIVDIVRSHYVVRLGWEQ